MAQGFRTPAGERTALRGDQQTILPGGRLLTPLGETKMTGPGSFGLAISDSGATVVTADGGPNRFALSLLDVRTGAMTYRVAAARRGPAQEAEDEDWKSVFQGLAFWGEDKLFASEGNSGRVRLIDVKSGRRLGLIELNTGGLQDSYSGDLALDAARNRLYVVDQANFRVAITDIRTFKVIDSIAVGRLPFAVTLSPDRLRIYVTNLGLFRYQALEGADEKKSDTGVLYPVFGFPSKESAQGTRVKTADGRDIAVPALGDPNVREANSLAVIDVSQDKARLVTFVRTGQPIRGRIVGGSSPSGVLATADKVYVTNAHNDSVSVIDAKSLKVERTIEIRIPGLEVLRGVLPIGLALHDGHLLVAEAGINAIGVIDLKQNRVAAHWPTAWFPTRLAVRDGKLYVACAKGNGTGPNDPALIPAGSTFQGSLRRGQLNHFAEPPIAEWSALTQRVLGNNGFLPAGPELPLPSQIQHVMIIVKENRTFDEVFGALENVRGKPALARLGSDREITFRHNNQKARGVVMPNHLALARRFATSDNFYADSEVSVDGHHWIVGSYPNAWTESTLMAAYGGQKDFRLKSTAPGRLLYPGSNSSVHPEEILEAGTLWHHLDRFGIPFRNYGEGYELAGGYEGDGAMPTGERLFTNMAIPEPLWRNTCWNYAQYNTNIPDEYRYQQFVKDFEEQFVKGGKPMPRLLFMHLPNDHMAGARPADGFPHEFSYAADNDLALGRIVAYLSRTPWWKQMAILVTEDDAQGGVDSIDSHRTVLLAISPYIRRGCVAKANSSFPGLLKTAFRLLGLPPLNLYDAAAADLAECFTAQPDFSAYEVVPVQKAIFDPALAKDPKDAKPGPRMDDPRVLEQQHKRK
jgi:YVTN family beta-propeller protein